MAKLIVQDFRRRFHEEVTLRSINWHVVGFYAADGKVYPMGTDTKVLSTVFESLCAPIVMAIAEEKGYDVTFSKQTIYPDFTLTPKGEGSRRIAIDIKTTYRNGDGGNIRFTLGSYTSFLRDGRKNIANPYAEYSDHWVIGFVYERADCTDAKVYGHVDSPSQLKCPYKNVQFFIQEKHKIAGTSPGSGNTTNIGSFPTKSLQDLIDGKGPFASSGHEAFENFWREYRKA
jgi:hypothetical protein